MQVADTGVGIAKDDLESLFKSFGKLKSTREINTSGIGLGLMISKSLVEAYGGNLSVFSPGKSQGSTFSFTMKMRSSFDISSSDEESESSSSEDREEEEKKREPSENVKLSSL